MTAAEMHSAFKILIDKEDSLNYPNFESAHIDFFLNEEGQNLIVKERYSGRPSAFGQAFEETQKRTDDLRILVTSASITPSAQEDTNKPNGHYCTLPSDYWFAINEEANIVHLDCNGESTTARVNVKPIQHDDYTKVIRDPFNRPSEDQVVRLMFQDKVEVIIPSGSTLTNYILRYIRKPRKISLSLSTDCELPDHLHHEVVKMAVKGAIRATQLPDEYQKILNELQRQE